MSHAWFSVLPGNYDGVDRVTSEDRLIQSAYLVEKDLLCVGCVNVHCIYVIPGNMTRRIHLDVELETVITVNVQCAFHLKTNTTSGNRHK